MKMILAAAASALLAAAPASAAGETGAVRACVKWSRDVPLAAGPFASVTRVGPGDSYAACDVVVAAESFGVGWLMSAWMKEAVLSPCGKRLGAYKFRYKNDEWHEKIVTGLHEFLVKHPEALAAAKDCPAPPPPAPAPIPAPSVEISTAPLAPSLPAEPVLPR